MNGDGLNSDAEDAAEDRAASPASPAEPHPEARVEAGPDDREDRSGTSAEAPVEAGPEDRSAGRPRGEGESRSAAATARRTVEPASSVARAGSAGVSDSRPKPDPVALLRDQLARLARGEAPTVVGGVTHVDPPHPAGAERARRRTALAAEAAEVAEAAAPAAEAATGAEDATFVATNPNAESTALEMSGDAGPTFVAEADDASAAASEAVQGSDAESSALDASPAADATSGNTAGESSARADSFAAGTSPDQDSESSALDGVRRPRDVGPATDDESGALDGERRQPAGRAHSHVDPASDNPAAGPSSPQAGGRTGGGRWAEPGVDASPTVPAAPAAAPATPPDQARRPFAAVAADVARLLTAAGAPERMAPQVATALGSEAAEQLAADPWALLAVPGITPRQADLLARGALGAGWAADDPRRVRGIVLWLLRRAARQGDTAIEADAARAALAHFEVSDPDTALRAILAEGRVMAFAAAPAGPGEDIGDSDEFEESDRDFEADFEDDFEEPDELAAAGGVLLALDDYALAEEAIAEAVVRLLSTVEPWPETGDTKLDGALSTNGVLLYAAGPGEEPPAAILTVARHAREAGLRVAVVAPTIDGRDRLGAGTIGLRELAAMERGPDGTLELDLLVVTDATLLDVTAAAAIFEAVPDGARLLLAGDPAGLESTGPGRVFTDLAATGTIRALVAPSVPEGPLEALADGIRDGRLPPIQDPERRAVLIPARTGEEAAHRCAQLVADSIPRAIGIAARDVLVVAPLATGPAGATALNVALKARLNPSPESSPEAGSSARRDQDGTGLIDVGDRVIRATTDPSGGVVQGVVRDVLPDGRVVVAFGDAGPEALHGAELRHGWALTARQSLGVRRPGAVVVLPSEGADAYTRALMYTLVTRGERHVSIVHAAGPALAAAVAAEPTRRRTTHLQQAMREAMS
ncbi:AAA family ATPase [Streptomyces sp. SID5474]|nr:AAA family ATPase [Streptomyces sp. SID5474]